MLSRRYKSVIGDSRFERAFILRSISFDTVGHTMCATHTKQYTHTNRFNSIADAFATSK